MHISVKELFEVFAQGFYCACVFTRFYNRVRVSVCEIVSRCGLCEFQANGRLRKSDSPVNTLSSSHNHELTTRKITEKHVCVL